MKRTKWEPLVAMLAMLGLGCWLVWGPMTAQRYDLRPGAVTEKAQFPGGRGIIESVRDPATGAVSFRILTREGFSSRVYTREEFEQIMGADVARAASQPNWMFRLFNITSWWSLAWIAVGFAGQIAFSGRTLIQWIVSEKSRQSVVPAVFWWLSLIGGIMLFAYFAWRQDVVGVLGQSTGIVIYARNLRLIFKHNRRLARQAGSAALADPGAPGSA